MNKLSWMLWFADFCTNIQGVLGAFSAFLSLGLLIMCIALFLGKEEIEAPFYERLKKVSKRIAITLAITWPLFTIVPSKSTVHAIIASELGEMFIAGKDVQDLKYEALSTIKAWLQKNR